MNTNAAESHGAIGQGNTNRGREGKGAFASMEGEGYVCKNLHVSEPCFQTIRKLRLNIYDVCETSKGACLQDERQRNDIKR